MSEGGGVSASPFDEPYGGSHPPADGRNQHRRLGLTYLGPPSREREEAMRRDWHCAVRFNPLSLPRETPRNREDDTSLMGATVHVNRRERYKLSLHCILATVKAAGDRPSEPANIGNMWANN